jgi:hypothetical protein
MEHGTGIEAEWTADVGELDRIQPLLTGFIFRNIPL